MTDRIKQGLGGKAGNKGAVLVRFDLDNTSVVVANAHLESGDKKLAERILQFNEIVNEGVIGSRQKKYTFKSHTVRMFMGDLNFRIDLEYDFARVAATNFSSKDKFLLQKEEQLTKIKPNEQSMYNIQEGPLNFPPTYRFDVNTDVYDTSK